MTSELAQWLIERGYSQTHQKYGHPREYARGHIRVAYITVNVTLAAPSADELYPEAREI